MVRKCQVLSELGQPHQAIANCDQAFNLKEAVLACAKAKKLKRNPAFDRYCQF